MTEKKIAKGHTMHVFVKQAVLSMKDSSFQCRSHKLFIFRNDCSLMPALICHNIYRFEIIKGYGDEKSRSSVYSFINIPA
jgi:hypothetical protein